jgi:hypothetical protein
MQDASCPTKVSLSRLYTAGGVGLQKKAGKKKNNCQLRNKEQSRREKTKRDNVLLLEPRRRQEVQQYFTSRHASIWRSESAAAWSACLAEHAR